MSWSHYSVMLAWEAVTVFAVSLAIMFWASVRLTSSFERIGTRLRFSEGLLGITTALGADAPEISSAFVALMSNNYEVGLGVVLGSNIFNLAGLLGLSALIAGRVSIGRQGLWFNGGTSLVVSAVVIALVMQWISVWFSLALLLLVLVPYVALTAMQPQQIAKLNLPFEIKRFLGIAIGHTHEAAHKQKNIRDATWKDVVWVAIAVVLIVSASIGAVNSAVLLGSYWNINHTVIGILVLAALTSVPNVIAAVHLAREGRGAAVVSESLNSNTLNILIGVSLPALLIGFTPPSSGIIFAAFWLFFMKLVALVAASHHHGLHRISGALIVLLYIIFALVIMHWK